MKLSLLMSIKMLNTQVMVMKFLFARISRKDPLEAVIMDGINIDELDIDSEPYLETPESLSNVAHFEHVSPLATKRIWREDLVRDVEPVSEEKEELKQLPSSLKYAFLEEWERKPVIISSTLTNLQEDKLLRVLRRFKSALGWTIDDIKGISLSICMHKVLLEQNVKPIVQHQRRLNPTMKDVVRKEIIKLLDAGIIYPISDSKWVSPVQVVP